MKTHNSFDEQYQFTGKLKTGSLIAIVIGVITIIAGFLTNHAEQTFDNLLLVGYYFTCVCAAGVMFCYTICRTGRLVSCNIARATGLW